MLWHKLPRSKKDNGLLVFHFAFELTLYRTITFKMYFTSLWRKFGGSLENRMRFRCEVIRAVRLAMPESMPLFVRISATDWVDGRWDVEKSIAFAKAICPLGVDLIDTFTGVLILNAHIP